MHQPKYLEDAPDDGEHKNTENSTMADQFEIANFLTSGISMTITRNTLKRARTRFNQIPMNSTHESRPIDSLSSGLNDLISES
jgi:hypothetical protein